jgi:hypothetical protein
MGCYHCRWKAANLDLCYVGFFLCQSMPWLGTSVFMVACERRVILISIFTFSKAWTQLEFKLTTLGSCGQRPIDCANTTIQFLGYGLCSYVSWTFLNSCIQCNSFKYFYVMKKKSLEGIRHWIYGFYLITMIIFIHTSIWYTPVRILHFCFVRLDIS